MENKLEKVQEELKNAKVMETNLDEFPQECDDYYYVKGIITQNVEVLKSQLEEINKQIVKLDNAINALKPFIEGLEDEENKNACKEVLMEMEDAREKANNAVKVQGENLTKNQTLLDLVYTEEFIDGKAFINDEKRLASKAVAIIMR